MPLTPASSGGYLGTAWMSLPLPSPGRSIGAGPSGSRAWTLFINADNFNGPVTYWLPQAWSAVTDGTPDLEGLGLDINEGFVNGFASEWNSVPFMTQTDATGTVFTKVPPTAFPIDSKGRTIFTRDAQAHSAGAIADRLSAWMAGRGEMPMDFDPSGAAPELFTTTDETLYQESPSWHIQEGRQHESRCARVDRAERARRCDLRAFAGSDIYIFESVLVECE